MVIYGWRQTVKELAVLYTYCRVCNQAGWQRIYRVLNWFTLFFIPLLPLWASRKVLCTTCGATTKIAKTEAEAMVSQAQMQAGATAGSQPGVAPSAPYPPVS